MEYFMIAPSAIDRVCRAYSEQWRSYHTTKHILGMLNETPRLPLEISGQRFLCLLIIYHDVWYKISREPGENERMSAAWAVEDIKHYKEGPEWLPALMQQGIEATITHTLEGVNEKSAELVAYLLDLDLWGLGQSPARFQEDTEAVWREFEPRYTRSEFDTGRSSWASTFLKRPQIYHTQHFQHLEVQARENLLALAKTK